jgi:hypothetical protein
MIPRRAIGMVLEMPSVTGPGAHQVPDCAELPRESTPLMRSLRAKALPYVAMLLSPNLASGAIVKVLDGYAHYPAYAQSPAPANFEFFVMLAFHCPTPNNGRAPANRSKC